MPRVGGDGVDLAPVAVQRQRVAARAVHPVALLDAAPQRACCFVLVLGRGRLAARVHQIGHCEMRGIEIALKLDGGQRRPRLLAARVDDGVAGILPALVDVALGTAGQIRLQAVAVAVAERLAPAQRTQRRLEVPVEQ